MNKDIRKISVGEKYPDGAIHYQVGKTFRLQHVPFTLHEINVSINPLNGLKEYNIYISNEDGKVLWKTVGSGIPVIIEYNINFE